MYKSYKGLNVSIGNLKLGSDTMIFNMGSGLDCPSFKKGLCKLGKRCYAQKAEIIYSGCKPYRDKQAAYWLNTPIDTILDDFEQLLRVRKVYKHGKLVRLHTTIKYFRFNESGDFYSQEDIEKLNILANFLKDTFDIDTYGYTARKDLDFRGVSFSVKGSGFDGLRDGKTIARKKSKLAYCLTDEYYNKGAKAHMYLENKEMFAVCPMDCRSCKLCKQGSYNVVFPLH